MNTLTINLKSIYSKTQLINLTIIFGLFLCIPDTFSQNTTITFNTKENVTIGISKEINNTYARTLTDEISTDAKGNSTYSWDVDNYQFVECFFHDGRTAFFPIKEGSNLTITYKGDGQIEFAGTDKAEIEYYLNDYKEEVSRPFLQSLWSFPPETDFEDISQLIEKYHTVLSNTLDSLVAENVISPKFSDIIKKDYNTLSICTGIGKQDSIMVEKVIDKIFDRISPMIDSGDILKHHLGSSALAVYYTNKYQRLNEKDKEELFSTKTWTNYLEPNKLGYLIAPEEMQYKLLSLELLNNYANAETKEDSAILNYISEIRPQSAFLPYIKEKRNELLASMNANHSGIKYIEETINALEDLSKVDDLDQKILYIDIWATWCAPCIAQFKYKDKLHELLSNYEDIITVYISIDDDNKDIAWKEKTKAFNLNGYHLRANKELEADIRDKLYDDGIIGIPRFILMGKEGTILEKSLSGPINMDKLKQELDKHFN